MTAGTGFPLFFKVSAAVFLILLLISGIADLRTRHIPRGCSYTLLLLSFVLLIRDGQYILAAYYLLAVLSTGNRRMKTVLFTCAVVVFANLGNSALPLVFGLAAADFLFALRIIGGGDAQLLFSMFAFGYGDWKMVITVSAAAVISGTFLLVSSFGFKKACRRIVSAAAYLKSGSVETDSERLRMPFAAVLPVSFLLYLFVSFSKL